MLRKVLHRRKKYVEVETLHRLDGLVMPLAVKWADGRRFEVRKVMNVGRTMKGDKGGGSVMYHVVIAGRETYLYYEHPLWWVDEKVYGAPVELDAGYDDSRDGARTYGRSEFSIEKYA